MGAIGDWRIIIYDIAAFITIGNSLWEAFKKIQSRNSCTELHFNIIGADNKHHDFILDDNCVVKDVFIRDFEKAVNQLSANESEEEHLGQLEHTVNSLHWQKYELDNSVNKNPQSFIH